MSVPPLHLTLVPTFIELLASLGSRRCKSDAGVIYSLVTRNRASARASGADEIEHGRTYSASITDAEDIRRSGVDTGWQRMTRQGPLQPGTMVDMGTFDCIIEYAEVSALEAGEQLSRKLDEAAEAIEITILGIYGSEDLLIGATRKFDLAKSDSGTGIRASEALTRQITRRHERKRLLKELNEQL